MVPLVLDYLVWHYTRALRDLSAVVRNFLWFFYNFFSIPLFLKTFFVPFHRLEEHAQSGFNIQAMFEAIVVTTLMRIVGAILRTFIIVLGLFFMLVTFVSGITLSLAWLVAPGIVIAMFFMALFFLSH